jgi:putative heme-binding domain-containing protein
VTRPGLRLVLLVGAVLAGFIWFCSAIPQIKAQPQDRAGILDVGESAETLVRVGKRIFQSDRAQCLTCHSLGPDAKARCPDQEGIGDRAKTTRAGYTAAQYLVESVYDPNAFIVGGYPSNQMTPVNKPPIALTHEEILAVLAFLNSLGSVTDERFVVELRSSQEPYRKGLVEIEEGPQARATLPLLPGDPNQGADVFKKADCLKCHRVGGDGADSAPDLTTIGASQTLEYILESILEPSSVIVHGYKSSTVRLKDGTRRFGIVAAWIPSEEAPEAVLIREVSITETLEYRLPLSDIRSIGDTVVLTGEGANMVAHPGYIVEGDARSGLTLRSWDGEAWSRLRFGPQEITRLNPMLSPMPSDIGHRLTVRELYDVVAYLASLKGDDG